MSAKKVAKKRVTEPAVDLEQAEPVNVPVEPARGAQNDNPEITVLDTRGNPHRTYSFEVHGETFRELAEEYVSSRPGWSLR